MKAYLSRNTNGQLVLTQRTPIKNEYADGTVRFVGYEDNELFVNESFLKGEFNSVTFENSPIEVEVKLLNDL